VNYWPRIVAGESLSSVEQASSGGSRHLKKEFVELKQNAPVHEMTATELVRLARCLTHSGYTGLELSSGKRRFVLDLVEI